MSVIFFFISFVFDYSTNERSAAFIASFRISFFVVGDVGLGGCGDDIGERSGGSDISLKITSMGVVDEGDGLGAIFLNFCDGLVEELGADLLSVPTTGWGNVLMCRGK